MAKAENKYIHPLGAKIRKYRNLKGLTQKELGEKCQLNESTIRNYELGNRYPDEVTLSTIADALGISQSALADPDPSKVFNAVQILFDLEERYGLTPVEVNGEVHLVQKPLKENASPREELDHLQMKQSLRIWNYIKKVYNEGNLLDEEYEDWKSLYPDFIETDNCYGYTEDIELEKRIEEVSSRIESSSEDEKASKRPRKTHL